jgi:hypothetical protein
MLFTRRGSVFAPRNVSNVITVQEAYGPRWLRPTTIQRGRNIRFGTQIRF